MLTDPIFLLHSRITYFELSAFSLGGKRLTLQTVNFATICKTRMDAEAKVIL